MGEAYEIFDVRRIKDSLGYINSRPAAEEASAAGTWFSRPRGPPRDRPPARRWGVPR